jgi:uncharacterized protein
MRRFRFGRTLVVEAGGLEVSAWVAESLAQRLFGLAGLAVIPAHRGLLIPRCASIHTWGMRFAIDVAFLAWPPQAGGEILQLWEAVEPRRWAEVGGRRARHTAALEAPAGTLRGLATATVTFRACPQGT